MWSLHEQNLPNIFPRIQNVNIRGAIADVPASHRSVITRVISRGWDQLTSAGYPYDMSMYIYWARGCARMGSAQSFVMSVAFNSYLRDIKPAKIWRQKH